MVGDAAFASRSGLGEDVDSVDEGDRGVLLDGFGLHGAIFTRRGERGIDGYFLAWVEDVG